MYTTNLLHRVQEIREARQVFIRKSRSKDPLEVMCIDKNDTFGNTFLLKTRFGSESRNGEAFKICYPYTCQENDPLDCNCDNDTKYLALKKIPLSESAMKHVHDITSPDALKNAVWVELMCMELARYLVENRVTPNLPLSIAKKLCLNCEYENEEITKNVELTSKCILLVNELATIGDLKTWLEEQRSVQENISALFQIFHGLYALQKYFNMTHHDLHPGNVLVHQLPKGLPPYLRYIIDGQEYIIPHCGFLFTIWDFGYAYIPDMLKVSDFENYFNWDKRSITNIQREDYTRAIYPFLNQKDEQTQSIIASIQNASDMKLSLKTMLHTFRNVFTIPQEELHDIPEEFTFDMDQKISLPEPFSRFLRPSLDFDEHHRISKRPAPETSPIIGPQAQNQFNIDIFIPQNIPRVVPNNFSIDLTNVVRDPLILDKHVHVITRLDHGIEIMVTFTPPPNFFAAGPHTFTTLHITNIPDHLFYYRALPTIYRLHDNMFKFTRHVYKVAVKVPAKVAAHDGIQRIGRRLELDLRPLYSRIISENGYVTTNAPPSIEITFKLPDWWHLVSQSNNIATLAIVMQRDQFVQNDSGDFTYYVPDNMYQFNLYSSS